MPERSSRSRPRIAKRAIVELGRCGKHKCARDTRGDRTRVERRVYRSADLSRAWHPFRSAGRLLSTRGKTEVCCWAGTRIAGKRMEQTKLIRCENDAGRLCVEALRSLRFCFALPADILISPRRHAY